MILDDVYIVDSTEISDCDTTDKLTDKSYVSLSKSEDVKQGNDAFKFQGTSSTSGTTVYRLVFADTFDLESYRNNNCSLRFWFCIDKPENVAGDYFTVRLGNNNDGQYVTQQYKVLKEYLVSGWNEIYINLADIAALAVNEKVDWTKIDVLQIVGVKSNNEEVYTGDCTMLLDDISIVAGNSETAAVRFVSTVESLGYQKVGYKIEQSFSPQNGLTTETTTVYNQLYQLGSNGKVDTFAPSDVSGLRCSEYLHGATIMNLPNRLWDAVFTVTPYWVTQDGTEVTGTPLTCTMNELINETRQVLATTTE